MEENKQNEEEIKTEESVATEPASAEPTEAEKAEIAKKAREEYEETIVVACREKLMPILKEANLNVKDSATMIETLFQTIQQAMISINRDKTIADLKITENINAEYPNSALYLKALNSIADQNISFILNCIQWFSRKLQNDLEDTYKDKTFSEVAKEF